MAAKHKSLSVYPHPMARAIIGGNAPACNRAIACWAQMIRRNHPTNLTRDDWNLLARMLGETIYDTNATSQTVRSVLNDTFTLIGADWKWYAADDKPDSTPRGMHPRGELLLQLIGELDYAGIQSILTTIQYFWSNKKIKSDTDEWWTLRFRVENELDH